MSLNHVEDLSSVPKDPELLAVDLSDYASHRRDTPEIFNIIIDPLQRLKVILALIFSNSGNSEN